MRESPFLKLSLPKCPLEVVTLDCHITCILRLLMCLCLWRYPVIPSVLQSCVIVLADELKDFVLLNNLIAIQYNSVCSVYLELTELSCWPFLVLLVSVSVHLHTLISTVSVDSRISFLTAACLHIFWGWFAEKTYSCIAVTCFAVSFCICALQVLEPETWFPALSFTTLLMQVTLHLPQSLNWSIMIHNEADHLFEN